MTRMSLNQRRTFVLGIIGVAITALGVGWAIFRDLFPVGPIEQEAAFSFVFEGAFDQSLPQYEVTHPLVWQADVPSKARVIVNAKYAGHDMQGPVYVKIQPSNADRPPVEAGVWRDFETDAGEPIEIPLSFYELYDYSGVSGFPSPDMSAEQPWGKNEGQFEIYVEYLGQKIASKTVSVLNVPWFHQAYLSDYEITAGNAVDLYVTVYNHGGSSEFEVNSCLYKVVTPSYVPNLENFSIVPDGWWTGKGLESVCGEYKTTLTEVSKNGQKTIVQNVPAELLGEQGVYTIVSWVIKKTPILEYDPSRAWTDAADIWRMRDGRQYVTLMVLQK